MRLAVGLDACHCMSGVVITVDDVPMIDDDGRDRSNAEAPGIGDSLIDGSELASESAAVGS